MIIPLACNCIDESINERRYNERIEELKNLKKLYERKDGLEVYKMNVNIQVFKCPFCNEEETNEEEFKKMKEQSKNNCKFKIAPLSYEFNSHIIYSEEIDFEKLEKIEHEIIVIFLAHDENCFYKYKCKNNHQFYIKLYETLFELEKTSPFNSIDDKRFLSENWKNNEKFKQELINEKKLKVKRKKYEEEYYEEFQNYCYEEEKQKVDCAIGNFDYYYEIYHTPDKVFLEMINHYQIQYYSNREIIKDFVEARIGEIKDWYYYHFYKDNEYFHDFIRERVGDDFDSI